MNDIDAATLDHIARLTKIDISEDDRALLLKDLDRILDYAQQLDKIETAGVFPCYHVLDGIVCPLREDEPYSDLEREVMLANAPQQTGGMVKIPPLMGE